VGPVVADDADDITAGNPKLDHAEREVAHAGLIIVPGEEPPQPEVLFAQRDLVCRLLLEKKQDLWIGVGLYCAGGLMHHAAFSARSRTSYGSTNSSSSSPR